MRAMVWSAMIRLRLQLRAHLLGAALVGEGIGDGLDGFGTHLALGARQQRQQPSRRSSASPSLPSARTRHDRHGLRVRGQPAFREARKRFSNT